MMRANRSLRTNDYGYAHPATYLWRGVPHDWYTGAALPEYRGYALELGSRTLFDIDRDRTTGERSFTAVRVLS